MAVVKAMAALSVGAAAAGTVISEYEKNHPVYAFYSFDSHGKLAEPVRFVFLTDLHEKEFGQGNGKLLEMIDAVSPDAVLIGGDMPTALDKRGWNKAMGKPEKKHRLLREKTRKNRYDVSLALCSKLAGRYPVYYGIGNHELRMRDGYMEKIAQMGIHVLDDSSADFKGVRLAGLTVPAGCYRRPVYDRPDAEQIRKMADPEPSGRYTVMMAHSPNFLPEYARTGADLVLCGHFHGGTIRLTDNIGMMTPQYQLFNANCHGIKHKDGTDMVISSGLGTHSFNIRINDRPEVVVIDIR